MASAEEAATLERPMQYRRVVLKISGEALAGAQGAGIDPDTVEAVATEVAEASRLGVQVALVVGGGNIWRGNAPAAKGMDRNTADYMGMLGTIINALALQSALEKRSIDTRVQTAIEMKAVAEPYIRRRAVRHLEKGRVVIFAGGTGNPYFTTDTTAALRAAEIEAEVMLKATQAEGVFDRDPREHPDAVMFEEIPYIDVLKRGLQVMDATATSLCMDNAIPIVVFDLGVSGNVLRVLRGEPVGTLVGDGRRSR